MSDPSEPSFFGEPEPERPTTGGGGRRAARRQPSRRKGCLPLFLAAVLVVGVVAAVGVVGTSRLRDLFGGAPDYGGPGSGRVIVQVHKGDSSTAIGRTLKDQGVVKSVEAFTDAASKNKKALGIQVGYYELKKQMKASDALDVLVDPHNLVQSVVLVPEGARVRDIVKTIVAKTDISRAAVVSALSHPAKIGLPAEADGNPEGYLFPATYTVPPGTTAVGLLRQMVAKTVEVHKELGVEAGAQKLGLSPEQLVTVASILEYEAKRDEDYPKVARAIYNRLDKGMKLQSDATVSYAAGVSGQIWTSASQRANASPYNTYQHAGLPPGPIGSPGEKTLRAAMHPADGPWLYWVVVNLRTGETVMSTTLAEHQAAVQQFREYCKTSDAC
jgi:UPF0755 protein